MAGPSERITGRDRAAALSRTPGSLGRNDAADPKNSISTLRVTPGPLAICDYADVSQNGLISPAHALKLHVLTFDPQQTLRFLRSVALAKAQQRFTRLDWKEYKEDQVINFIYKLMPWKAKPGWADVNLGDPLEVEKTAEADVGRLMAGFLDKAVKGPGEAVRYLEAQQEIRGVALQTVDDTIKDAIRINQELVKTTGDSIKILGGIKCSSTLAVKGLGLFVPGIGQGIDFGHSVILSTIEDWNKAHKAQVIALAVGEELLKEETKVLLEQTAEYYESKKILEGERFAENIKRTEALIDRHAEKLSNAVQKKMTLEESGKRVGRRIRDQIRGNQAELTRRINERHMLQKNLAKSGKLARTAEAAGRSVKFVFAAYEAYEAIDEFAGLWKASD